MSTEMIIIHQNSTINMTFRIQTNNHEKDRFWRKGNIEEERQKSFFPRENPTI